MQQTLLSTKLNAPPSRQKLVARSALQAELRQARNYRLTLVSAPAGYGKTTLVSSWLSQPDLPFAWLSLDEGDNDPIRFIEYFLAALHVLAPAIRLDMLDLLQGAQAVSYENFISIVINAAADVSDFFLVLDDFHVLHEHVILDMVTFLLDHLPPQIHLVLLSRTDPPLPLSRLRVRGQLLEIRAEKLRFSLEEIAQFYEEILGVKLNQADLAALETRTEGWVAGLQLAGLAMQSAFVSQGGSIRAAYDPHSFIAAFTGSHAYIMDYLTEEVLHRQAEITQSFLLQTSILDRMCGPLCEAVVGTGTTVAVDGQAMLEAFERDHLFIASIDTERRWFRYHLLFKEVLHRRMEVQYPGQIPRLHLRASEWFEQHGLYSEAIQHAIGAGDSERIARLVEQYGCVLLMGGELVTLAVWLSAIETYTRTRPWLAMQKAWVLSLSGQLASAELAIQAGEQLLSTLEPTDEVRTLQGSFAAARAHWANSQGKTDLAARYARQAIDLLSVSGDFSCALRSVATSLLGDASWAQGKMEEAQSAYSEAVQIGQAAGNPHMTMMSNTSLADVYFEQGQLEYASRLYLETLQMADRIGEPNSAYVQSAYFGLGRVFYTWNRLDEAAKSIEKCRHLCQLWGSVHLEAACLAFTAELEFARGDPEKAHEAATAAEELIREKALSPYWSMWVKTALAGFWLAQGQVEKALFVLHGTGILPDTFRPDMVSQASIHLDEPIPYRLEQAYIVLARLFWMQGNPDAVMAIIERLFPGSKVEGRGKAMVELLILQALTHHAKKDTPTALAVLERAIILAWPERATRPFLNGGERMVKLLYQAKAHNVGGEFVEGLLNCFGQLAETEPSHHQPVQSLLAEPLSARELEVLKCIAEGCSNQEIADRFVLSPKTVKRHISNIFAKLDAKNRSQAVALARTLKLID